MTVPGLLDVILLYDCNLACDFCTVMADVGDPDGFAARLRGRSLPTARVVRAMRDARASGYDAVSFTGGEPTLRPDLLALVGEARRLGFASIKLQTNGLLLGTEANVAKAITAGVNLFHVSIHAHREPRYDAIVRASGRYPAMVAALDHLASRGVELVADVLVSRDSMVELPDAIAWLAEHRVRRADLWLVSLTDANRARATSLPSLAELVPHVREALALGRSLAMDVRSLHLPRCVLGEDHVHAFDPGRGRVRVLSPDDDFELHDSKLTPRRHVPACEGCAHRPLCPGLRPDYLELHGDRDVAAVRGVASTIAPSRRLPVDP
jgi:cyclic pyranopterin phosphate synthase